MDKKIRVIFNAFRAHIVDVCDNKSLRDTYVKCDSPKKKAALFSRVRVWTFRRLVQAIMSCFKRTLSVEIMEFLDKEKLPQTTPEAFIKRRGFVSSELFRDLSTWLLKTADRHDIFPKWFNGRYLCGIDGTRLSLPYTPELYEKYRGRTGNGHNLARGVFITDLVSRMILAADIVPDRTEERKASLNLLAQHELPMDIKSIVFEMDRGYPSLMLMNWFHSNTGGFVIRARRDTNPQISAFMESDKSEETVTLRLSKNRYDIDYPMPEPLTVRLIRRPYLKDGEEPVVLITDLDSDAFPADIIIEAYRMRWNVETEIGTAKNELQIEIFSGIREICIRQDFFAAILLYNMGSLIRLPLNKVLASGGTDKKYQVDMNCTWALIVTLIEDFFKPQKTFDRELTFCLKFCLHVKSIIRRRRSYPRIKRVIKLNGKYITLTNYKRGL